MQLFFWVLWIIEAVWSECFIFWYLEFRNILQMQCTLRHIIQRDLRFILIFFTIIVIWLKSKLLARFHTSFCMLYYLHSIEVILWNIKVDTLLPSNLNYKKNICVLHFIIRFIPIYSFQCKKIWYIFLFPIILHATCISPVLVELLYLIGSV